MTEQIKDIESALKKVKDQKENFGFMDRFTVDENWEVTKALEKQIPKKPIDVQKPVVRWGICPTCKGLPEELGRPQRVFQSDNYCSNCGQKIDWSEYDRD